MIIWVRNKIGRNFQGWRSYDNWANSPEGIEEEYLLDDRLRLRDGTQPQRDELPIQEGLLLLRSTLSAPRTSVRLAGLSGVGKTRLVQALFDKRIGSQALSTSLPIYTDISYNPEPSPESIAEQLISQKTKAILIVDNCPPDLHRRLTEICSQHNSNVSLLTIEYDIQDDIPNETNVFRLEPASEELIEKLISKRYPHISQVDAHTIAYFSGGNARIGIALANTVKHNETLSGFNDNRLFERL
jgi:Cdc6-like AAA superfamily ATPase